MPSARHVTHVAVVGQSCVGRARAREGGGQKQCCWASHRAYRLVGSWSFLVICLAAAGVQLRLLSRCLLSRSGRRAESDGRRESEQWVCDCYSFQPDAFSLTELQTPDLPESCWLCQERAVMLAATQVHNC